MPFQVKNLPLSEYPSRSPTLKYPNMNGSGSNFACQVKCLIHTMRLGLWEAEGQLSVVSGQVLIERLILT